MARSDVAEYVTADGYVRKQGDEVFDYYSFERVIIGEPAGSPGWFNTMSVEDPTVFSRAKMLNGDRICTLDNARRRGWLDD